MGDKTTVKRTKQIFTFCCCTIRSRMKEMVLWTKLLVLFILSSGLKEVPHTQRWEWFDNLFSYLLKWRITLMNSISTAFSWSKSILEIIYGTKFLWIYYSNILNRNHIFFFDSCQKSFHITKEPSDVIQISFRIFSFFLHKYLQFGLFQLCLQWDNIVQSGSYSF